MTTINPEVFDRAAERVERDGMTKGAYYPGWGDNGCDSHLNVRRYIQENNPRVCAFGALYAEAGTDDATDYFIFFAKVLGLAGSFDIAEWNDLPSRRKAHLVKAFRKAAEKARESA